MTRIRHVLRLARLHFLVFGFLLYLIGYLIALVYGAMSKTNAFRKKRNRELEFFWCAEVFCILCCSHTSFTDIFCAFNQGFYLFDSDFVFYHFAEVVFMTGMWIF